VPAGHPPSEKLSTESPWQAVAGGVIVTLRLTPKGGRDAIDGVETRADGQPVLKVRVRAAPTEGEANAALLKLLAHALGIPARDLTLVGGAAARVKRVKITGDGNALMAALAKCAAVG